MNKLLVALLSMSLTSVVIAEEAEMVVKPVKSSYTKFADDVQDVGQQFIDAPFAIGAELKDAGLAIKDVVEPVGTRIKEKTLAVRDYIKNATRDLDEDLLYLTLYTVERTKGTARATKAKVKKATRKSLVATASFIDKIFYGTIDTFDKIF